MLFLQTAWKNLFRYKRRTLITASAIAVGVMCSIALDGILYGSSIESNRNIIWYESSSAKIFSKGYFTDKQFLPTQYLLEKSDRKIIEDNLIKNNINFTPRYITNGEAIFTEEYFPTSGSVNIIITAIDSIKDSSVYRIKDSIEKGTWITKGNSGIVIGSWLAQDIKADVGYVMTIACKGRGGFYQTFDIPIVGIILTDNPIINMTYAYMDLDFINDILELDNAVTEYSIAFDSSANLSLIDKKYLQYKSLFNSLSLAQSGDIEIYSWKELNADILTMIESKKSISNVMLILIFIIAAVGISNTMLMAVMERKNEIAMLKSLGYSSFQVKCLFMYEGFFIGFIGSITGFILGILLTWYLVIYGIDFSYLFRDADLGFRITGIMRSAWDIPVFIQISMLALVVSAISAYVPTRAMLKKEIAELFRSV